MLLSSVVIGITFIPQVHNVELNMHAENLGALPPMTKCLTVSPYPSVTWTD